MGREVRVVADTNVLISALLFGGSPEQIFLAALRGDIQLLSTLPILKELEKVLIGKFKLSAGFIKDTLDLVEEVAEIVETTSRIKVILHPDEDNRVLECAIDGKADFIVTGDTKHILPLREYEGIKILSPSQFIKHLPSPLP
jgi:putative PIN family toxin of toxin-antitoxin system